MLAALDVRDLLLVSWAVDPDVVARALPAGLEPQVADGEAWVSAGSFRLASVRVDGRRAPAFSQADVRAGVVRNGEPGVFFFSLRVTPFGLGGVLLGAPYRPSSIRIRPGEARARGLGLSFRYQAAGASAAVPYAVGPTPLLTVAYYGAAGLRRVELAHETIHWRQAELLAEPRFEPVTALGFDVGRPGSTVSAAQVAVKVELPPRKVA